MVAVGNTSDEHLLHRHDNDNRHNFHLVFFFFFFPSHFRSLDVLLFLRFDLVSVFQICIRSLNVLLPRKICKVDLAHLLLRTDSTVDAVAFEESSTFAIARGSKVETDFEIRL